MNGSCEWSDGIQNHLLVSIGPCCVNDRFREPMTQMQSTELRAYVQALHLCSLVCYGFSVCEAMIGHASGSFTIDERNEHAAVFAGVFQR